MARAKLEVVETQPKSVIEPPRIYDIGLDDERLATQDDVDHLQAFSDALSLATISTQMLQAVSSDREKFIATRRRIVAARRVLLGSGSRR